MSDFEIATYVQNDPSALGSIADSMVELARQLGAGSDLLEMWRTDLHWNKDGSGPAVMGPSIWIPVATSAHQPLQARPYLMANASAGESGQPWFLIGFVFGEEAHLEAADADQHWRYRRGVGAIVWRLAWTLHERFPGALVIFGASPLILMPWKALTGRNGDLWCWDLAIVPPPLIRRFEPIPEGFESIQIGETVALARADAWHVLPWTETSAQKVP